MTSKHFSIHTGNYTSTLAINRIRRLNNISADSMVKPMPMAYDVSILAIQHGGTPQSISVASKASSMLVANDDSVLDA